MAEKKVQKRTIESREKLRTAAWELFCEKGFFNTNTKEIARTAGISVGNFYNYYKDKKEIYFDLAQSYVKGSTGSVIGLGERLSVQGNGREVIAEYIRVQMERAKNTGRFFGDCQVLVRDEPELLQLFQNDTEEITRQIELMLQRIPGVKKRASYYIMARLLFTVVDQLSTDVCALAGTEQYIEYQNQMILLVQNYVFGEE